MDKEKTAAVYDLLYLIFCVINGETPDKDRVSGIDLELIYSIAERHSLLCIAAYALEKAGIKDEKFSRAKGKAIRRAAIFDMERANVLSALDKAEIWYLPLKGCVLKELYPQIGMREMADNDILFDNTRADDVRAIMEDLGFTVKSFGLGAHDSYLKPPVSNFEMHRTLFADGYNDNFRKYYKNVKSRLIKDDNSFCHSFRDGDFYIYMIGHEYKHYSQAGTGLRSLLDTYVFLKQKGGALDFDYIDRETEKLGISSFEKENRQLSLSLFGGGEQSAENKEMLGYVASSGTYGTLKNHVENQLNKNGNSKIRYILKRVFLPMDTVRASFPAFAKYPVLLPFLPAYRLIRGMTKHGKTIFTELKMIIKYNKKQGENK